MNKKRYALFIKKRSKNTKLGWYGFHGLFFSIAAAEKSVASMAKKHSNIAEIVDFSTLEVVRSMKKGLDDEWK